MFLWQYRKTFFALNILWFYFFKEFKNLNQQYCNIFVRDDYGQ